MIFSGNVVSCSQLAKDGISIGPSNGKKEEPCGNNPMDMHLGGFGGP